MKWPAIFISVMAFAVQVIGGSPGALVVGEPFQPPAGGVESRQAPDVAFGSDTWLVVWQEGWNGLGGNSGIFGARVAVDPAKAGPGVKALDEKPITIAAATTIRERPRVAFAAGKGVFLAVWQEFNGADYDVYGARVAPDGKVPDGDKPIAIAGGNHNQARPAVASDGENFLVVWQDFRRATRYEIYGARVSAEGKLLDAEPVALGEAGHSPTAGFGGGEYLVTVPGTTMRGLRVSKDGKPLGVVKASGPGGREGGSPAIAGGNDGCIVVASRSPDPDPWGWCGPAGIMVYTFKNGAFAPEMPGGYAPDIAMRQIPHVLDSSRWKDVTGWPAGMRGQFKGTQNGLWPSYHTAVCHDGRHAVAIWAAKRLERGDRPHDGMDLYGARVDAAGGDAVNYDPLPVPVALGPGSQSGPRLAAGPTGASLLVCESRKGSEPAIVECRLLSDTPDTRAPAIERVSVDQPTSMRVFFDEPLDPASAPNAGAYKIEGVEIKLAALRRHRFAEPRVVTLTTSEQKVGDARRLKVNGVKDRAGNEVKDGACDYVFAPGQPLEPGVIPQWLVLGPFRADWKAKYVDPETARPKAGDSVEAESGGKKLQRAWTGAGTTGSGGVLRFSNVLGKQSGEMGGSLDKCTAFAHLYVWSPRAGPVNVCVDSNDGQRTWVNGKEAGFTDASRGLGEAIDVNKAEFVKGWNRLLIECDNKIGVWLMVVRITDDAGHEIEGLNWQLNDPGKE